LTDVSAALDSANFDFEIGIFVSFLEVVDFKTTHLVRLAHYELDAFKQG
jgi:hypothetical protein